LCTVVIAFHELLTMGILLLFVYLQILVGYHKELVARERYVENMNYMFLSWKKKPERSGKRNVGQVKNLYVKFR